VKKIKLSKVNDKILTLISEGRFIVGSRMGDLTAIIGTVDHHGDHPDCTVIFVDAKPSDLKAAFVEVSENPLIKRMASDVLRFVDLPPLKIGTDFDDEKIDIAPMVYALFHGESSICVGEACMYAHSDDLAENSPLVDPILLAKSGYEDFDGHEYNPIGYLTVAKFGKWADKMAKSKDMDVKEIGKFVKQKIKYFKNHDLEGNKLGKDGEPIFESDLPVR
jgi:hypothetical protein